VQRESDGAVTAMAETKLACVGRDGRLRRLPSEIGAAPKA
jgi:acyl-CoA thioesterase FadM